MGRLVRYALTRLALAVVVLWGAATLAFLTLHLTPGNPVDTVLGPLTTVSDSVKAQIRQDFGLDQPLSTQYVDYLGRLLTGDLGRSYQLQQPVAQVIGDQLWPTVQLAVSATVLALVVSVVVAVTTSGRRKLPRLLSSAVELVAVSAPPFWIGIILLTFFSFRLELFPVAGREGVGALVLPTITMALPIAAILTQVLRHGLDGALRQPFAITARARGLSEGAVRTRHALRHSTIPALTLTGFVVGSLLGGAVLAETVFGRPGLGRVAVQAIQSKDIPVVMGIVVLSAVVFVVINIVIDLLYLVVDPRLRTD